MVQSKGVGFDPTGLAKVKLLFIDCGNREMGEVAGLKILPPTLLPHPPLALECFLPGVEPSEGQGSFSGDASELMLERLDMERSCVRFEAQFGDSAGHYRVSLSGGEGLTLLSHSLMQTWPVHFRTP